MPKATAGESVEISKVNALKDGEMKSVDVSGHDFLLAKVEGKFYACDNRCPHMGGKLAEGKLEGTVVTCPVHASQYDLKDGHVIRWTNWSGIKLTLARLFKPPRPVKIYPVKVEGDKVSIEM